MHNTLLANYAELKSIFGAYCKSLGEAADNAEMDMDEFRDFVLDCRIETEPSVNTGNKGFTFEQMGKAFEKANQSGKGAAGPPADAQLQFYEFLNVLCRVSFDSMNPSFGELLAGDGETHDTVPVPFALKTVLETKVLPDAHRDDAPAFRKEVYGTSEVQAVVKELKPKVVEWFKKLPFDAEVSESKLSLKVWEATLKQP